MGSLDWGSDARKTARFALSLQLLHRQLHLRLTPRVLKVMPVTETVNAQHSGRKSQKVVANAGRWLDIRGAQDPHLRCFALPCI